MGIFIGEKVAEDKVNDVLDVYLQLLQSLRKQKDFPKADAIRDFLNNQNIIIRRYSSR